MENPNKKVSPRQLPPDCNEEERFDAMRLIRVGNSNKDDLTKRVGQARLRVLEERPTPEDVELLNLDLKNLKLKND